MYIYVIYFDHVLSVVSQTTVSCENRTPDPTDYWGILLNASSKHLKITTLGQNFQFQYIRLNLTDDDNHIGFEASLYSSHDISVHFILFPCESTMKEYIVSVQNILCCMSCETFICKLLAIGVQIIQCRPKEVSMDGRRNR